MIILWSGWIETIPVGWLLCDGENETPNLVSRFVLGAKGMIYPGKTGGSSIHTHKFTGDGHSHGMRTGGFDVASGVGWMPQTHDAEATGTTDNGGLYPPYYALAYIMKT